MKISHRTKLIIYSFQVSLEYDGLFVELGTMK